MEYYMKKLIIILGTGLILNIGTCSFAHKNCDDNPPPPPPEHEVVTTETQYDTPISGCNRHYLGVHEITTTYSPNDVRVTRLYTVYNADGSVIISNCKNAQHLIKDSNHYFLINNNKIIDEAGNSVTGQTYASAYIIAADRIKVSKNISFMKSGQGIIDFGGKEVVPVIYQQIKQSKINNNLYITKKDGYYGLLDLNNNILLKNEYDNVKELQNTYILKKYSLYGLADINGNVILPADNEKIERLGGEYIKVKKYGKWGIFDRNGNRITSTIYQDVKIQRDTIYGKKNDNWIKISE